MVNFAEVVVENLKKEVGGPRRLVEGAVWSQIVSIFGAGWGRQEACQKKVCEDGPALDEHLWGPILTTHQTCFPFSPVAQTPSH